VRGCCRFGGETGEVISGGEIATFKAASKNACFKNCKGRFFGDRRCQSAEYDRRLKTCEIHSDLPTGMFTGKGIRHSHAAVCRRSVCFMYADPSEFPKTGLNPPDFEGNIDVGGFSNLNANRK